MFQSLVNYISSVPDEAWVHGVQIVIGSTAVATALQILKFKLNIQDAKKAVTVLLGVLSAVTATADFVLQSASLHPGLIGKETAQIIALAVFIHRFAVSPLYNKFYLTLTSLVSDARAYRAAKQQPIIETHPIAVETPQVFQV